MPPDEVQTAIYLQVATSVDRILIDSTIWMLFISQLPPEYRTTEPEVIAHCLFYLRNRGRLPWLLRQSTRKRGS
jgi:hypothetical protein